MIQAMCEVIPFMALMKWLYFIFDIHLPNPEDFLKVFKDNQSFISFAESNKISTRTKQVADKYRCFWIFVQKKIIQMCYIDTRYQTAEIFNKPLDEALFIYIWEEKYLDGDLKSETFVLTQGVLRIKTNKWFDLSGILYIKIPQEIFSINQCIIHTLTFFITRIYGNRSIQSDLSHNYPITSRYTITTTTPEWPSIITDRH